jgi:PAS domain S-box-containing protein
MMDQHAVIVAGTSGVITEWNHVAETLFGYRADEAVGQGLDLVVPEHWQQAHWAGFHRAMNGHSHQRNFSASPPNCGRTAPARPR